MRITKKKSPEDPEIILNCIDIKANDDNHIKKDAFEIVLYHKDDDPKNVNRLKIVSENHWLELYPSKGLSVGELFIKDKPVLWDPPSPLFDPDDLDLLSDEVCINGEPSPGFLYIKTYNAGIELLGLNNWGMPRKDEATGDLFPLHGEASLIPVEKVSIIFKNDGLLISGTFTVRSFKGNDHLPWYKKGEEVYLVTRNIFFSPVTRSCKVEDIIKNISNITRTPDWGYHITLHPENGAKYLVPGKYIENRGGGELPDDIETWAPAANPAIRSETGIIHKGLKITHGLIDNKDGNLSLCLYPDGSGIAVSHTLAPYFQTWFCCGGTNSREFTFKDGTPVLKKNWDGMGIEIGSSPLDHDCNIDPDVEYNGSLRPGEEIRIKMMFEFLDTETAQQLSKLIEEYNQDRQKIE